MLLLLSEERAFPQLLLSQLINNFFFFFFFSREGKEFPSAIVTLSRVGKERLSAYDTRVRELSQERAERALTLWWLGQRRGPKGMGEPALLSKG